MRNGIKKIMNKTTITFISLIAIAAIAFAFQSFSKQQGKEPWTEKQLMPPAELVKIINDGSKLTTYVFSIGPSGLIKNSVDIGEGKTKSNIEKLRVEVSKLPKDASIVIYCGCCPFNDCPNIRPAFNLLNEMKFTNHKLLNLPKNLKVDWIDNGYPMNK